MKSAKNGVLQVGSDLTRPEIQAIGTHMKVHGHVCKLCSPQWLRRCLATRQELPVTAALELRAAALLDTVTRAAKEAEDRQAEAAAAAALAAAGEVGYCWGRHTHMCLLQPLTCNQAEA